MTQDNPYNDINKLIYNVLSCRSVSATLVRDNKIEISVSSKEFNGWTFSERYRYLDMMIEHFFTRHIQNFSLQV